MTRLITIQRAAFGVCCALLGFVGLWSDVSDAIVGVPKPKEIVRNIPARKAVSDRTEQIQTDETIIVRNALKRANQQAGDYSVEFTTTANCTFVQVVATMDAAAQASSKRLDLKLEKFNPATSQWIVIGGGARTDPAPGANLAIGIFEPTGTLRNIRMRAWCSNLEVMYYGLDLESYDNFVEE